MIAALLASTMFSTFAINQTGDQTYAVLRGSLANVSVQSFQPIADATVVAVSDADVETTQTDKSGRFFFLNLMPGIYQVRVVPQGSWPYCDDEDASRKAQELAPGTEYQVDIRLSTDCR